MPLADAGQPEIIRANQKDNFYIGQLRSGASEVCRACLGKGKYFASYHDSCLKTRIYCGVNIVEESRLIHRFCPEKRLWDV